MRAAVLLAAVACMSLAASESAKDFIKRHEGCRLTAYRDGKGWAIGRGHWTKFKPAPITKQQADELFDRDYANAWQASYVIAPYSHPPQVRKALVSLTYQLGYTGLLKFVEMLVALEQRDYDRAADELMQSQLATQTPSRTRECAELIRSAQ